MYTFHKNQLIHPITHFEMPKWVIFFSKNYLKTIPINFYFKIEKLFCNYLVRLLRIKNIDFKNNF